MLGRIPYPPSGGAELRGPAAKHGENGEKSDETPFQLNPVVEKSADVCVRRSPQAQ